MDNMAFFLVIFTVLISAVIAVNSAVEMTCSDESAVPAHVSIFKVPGPSPVAFAEMWQKIFREGGFNFSQPYSFLEIGSLEGRSTVWFLENALVHPNSTISCVDPWHGGHKYTAESDEVLYERFVHNTIPYRHKMRIFRGKSFDALRDPIMQTSAFDFIFIDGGKRSRNTLEDAVLSFPLLKIGGLMVFDDFVSNLEDPHSLVFPKAGIDAFLHIYSKSLRIEGLGYKLIITKTAE
jgi:predicted O-methyltransferase YrrM